MKAIAADPRGLTPKPAQLPDRTSRQAQGKRD
jgi:hypothetical protein